MASQDPNQGEHQESSYLNAANMAGAAGLASPSMVDMMSPTAAKKMNQFQFPDTNDELFWTTDVVYQVIHAYSAKMLKHEHDLKRIGLMQDKLGSYRGFTTKLMKSDWKENLEDLRTKVDKVFASNVEFFGYRQLPYMMHSFFFQQ